MDKETTNKLEAWFDGEVTAGDCVEIEDLLLRDPEARKFVDALNQTRDRLNRAHQEGSDAASAWTNFSRKLDRLEEHRKKRLIRFPHIVAAAAAVMVFGMLMWIPFRSPPQTKVDVPGLESSVYMVETDLEDAVPIVYIDQPSGWTVVWVMEPEESPEKS